MRAWCQYQVTPDQRFPFPRCHCSPACPEYRFRFPPAVQLCSNRFGLNERMRISACWLIGETEGLLNRSLSRARDRQLVRFDVLERAVILLLRASRRHKAGKKLPGRRHHFDLAFYPASRVRVDVPGGGCDRHQRYLSRSARDRPPAYNINRASAASADQRFRFEVYPPATCAAFGFLLPAAGYPPSHRSAQQARQARLASPLEHASQVHALRS
jgi:hypothetical protein